MRPERVLAVLMVAFLVAGCAASGGTRSKPKENSRERAAQLNVQLGQSYLQRGDLEIAMEKLEKALQLDPRSADAHTVIAVLYERIGRPEAADEHYRRSLQLAPDDGAMLNNYGTYLCRNRRFDEADAAFVKALADPFYKTPNAALTNAGVCAMQGGRLDAAEAYFRRVIETEAGNAAALFQLAQISFQRGDFMRARGFMQRHEAAAPTSPQALLLSARIEESLGNAAAAGRYRERLRSEFPDYQPPQTQPGSASS